MFKRMKLSTKIVSGFVVVLALTAMVGFWGHRSLRQARQLVYETSVENRLLSLARDAQVREKRYIISGDMRQRDEFRADMAVIHGHITDAIATESHLSDRETLVRVGDEAREYEGAFDRYVVLGQQGQSAGQGQETASVAGQGGGVDSSAETGFVE